MENEPLRVLIIDDDPSVRELLRDVVQFLGHEVEMAADGYEGLALFDPERHDVVVTDLQMPGLTGWDVIDRLRMLHGDVRVVIVTASATSATVERARLAHIPVVHKPVRIDELQAALRPRLSGASGIAYGVASLRPGWAASLAAVA